MISYSRHILSNGLTLLIHEDASTPLATVNTLYKVGSRNESPERTGFAHLFEHLMFGGTPAVPDFDREVSMMGGESNAFTNNDYTDYYITAPSDCLRSMLMLEADRMRGLDFNERPLSVQRNVVVEEYKQRYMGTPYADKWLLLRPLCFRHHPYRWCPIGADIEHVRQATVADEVAFFNRHYTPDNAIVSVVGDVCAAEVLQMVQSLYGDIGSESLPRPVAELPVEPEQQQANRQEVFREVPSDALFIAYRMCSRTHPDFFVYDVISDILSNGKSSRMYNRLVKDLRLFSEVDAYITGDWDQGLFVVDGRLMPGVSMQQAENAVYEELELLKQRLVDDYELLKVVNKFESTFAFSQYQVPDRALGLCVYEFMGHVDWVNNEPQRYRCVTPADVRRVATQCFQQHRANVLYYRAANANQ